jgi:hypothetical protein
MTQGVRRLLAVLGMVALTAGSGMLPAAAAPVQLRAGTVGYDVSYPQCGSPLPTQASFVVVGVDGGKPYDPNPCLAEQIVWARSVSGKPSYYVNTANPGPRMSSFWPIGQRSPRTCTRAKPDSEGCAYDYGWNAAKDSLVRAKAAARAVGAPSVTSSTWWLDVETSNTWESLEYGERPKFLRNDVAVLQGMARLLERRGVKTVGVYSTTHQWQRITGGASLDRAPIWYSGVGSLKRATNHCKPKHSFTGGRIRISQYALGGYDANVRCPKR